MARAAAILLLAAVALLAAVTPATAARKLLTCSTSGCKNWGFPYNSAPSSQLGDTSKDCGSDSVSPCTAQRAPGPAAAADTTVHRPVLNLCRTSLLIVQNYCCTGCAIFEKHSWAAKGKSTWAYSG